MPNDMLSAPSVPKDSSRALQDKPVAVVSPLVSVVIPCCGMLEYTRICLRSVMKHTRMPYELIFLDIGSLDGTADYLNAVQDVLVTMPQLRVEVVRTPTDLGISKACREAMERCRGEFIVLLNNDTIVTQGWVKQLIALLTASPATGLVGPMSNYAAPPQLVETVPYRSGPRKSFRPGDDPGRTAVDVDAIQSFAAQHYEANKGQCLFVERLGGFCLMLKREVYKKLEQQGILDKVTDLSLFDSDVLSAAARQFGYNLGICRDVFIHHFGTRTFAHGAPASAGTTGAAQST